LGLAVRFALPSGGHSTWAAASISAFPARTPDEFVQLTEAQRPIGPNPAKVLRYLLRHRHALAGLRSIAGLKPPVSFLTTRFHGLHAYFLVAPDGTRRAFRYTWVPEAGVQDLAAEADRSLPGQYLLNEARERAGSSWTLEFTLATRAIRPTT
jgi:catalase